MPKLSGGALLAVVAAMAVACGSSAPRPVVGTNLAISSLNPPATAFQEPFLATDPAVPGHLALAYQEGNRSRACYLGLSTDGGSSWKTRAIVGVGASYGLPDGADHCQNPKVAFGPGSELHYVFQDAGFRRTDPHSLHSLVMSSANGGSSFSAPRVLDPGFATPNDWYPLPLVNPASGALEVAWSRYAQNATVFPGEVLSASSSSRGASFGLPTQVWPPSGAVSTTYVGGPTGAVGDYASGHQATTYLSYLPSVPGHFSFVPSAIQVSASNDGGRSFSTRASPGNVARAPCLPTTCVALRPFGELASVAAEPGSNTVFLAWWDDRGPGGRARVSFTSSTNGATSWAPPRTLGVPAGLAGDQQYRPSLSLAPDGRLDLAYYDLGPGGTEHVRWSYSTDQGKSFSAPLVLDPAGFNAKVGPGAGGSATALMGQYLGLASADDAAYVAWTDTRRGNLDTGHQDIYFAKVAGLG